MQTTHLGQNSTLPTSPEEAVLDYVPNPRPDELYLVRFAAPEFTSLCPVTGQPDFAHLVIDYAPDATIVESKSLKLFLGASATTGLSRGRAPSASASGWSPKCSPNGCASAAIGIRAAASRSTCSGKSGEPPDGLWLPDQGVPGYRGRG